MPPELYKPRSPSPDSSKQILCIDGPLLTFSEDHLRQSLNHNNPYSTSGRSRPERPNVVVQVVLVPRSRRRHESTNRAGHLWVKLGNDNSGLSSSAPIFKAAVLGLPVKAWRGSARCRAVE